MINRVDLYDMKLPADIWKRLESSRNISTRYRNDKQEELVNSCA